MYITVVIRIFYIDLSPDIFANLTPNKAYYRHPITDRKDRIIAFTEDIVSICVDPTRVIEDAFLEQHFPGIKAKVEKARLRNKKFMWLKRDCDKGLVDLIKKRRISGVYVKNDQKRVCTRPEIFSRIIGFCDKDMDGKSGIENGFNEHLRSSPLKLTIDLGMQVLLHKTLDRALSDFDGEGACGLVLEVPTGNILAMVSLPSTQVPKDFIDSSLRNRVMDAVEVGSVLKLVNVANALESGAYSPYSIVDAKGPLKIGNYEIHDFFGANADITLRESLWRSSNIANARVALDLGHEYQYSKLKELGMLDIIRLYPNSSAKPIPPKYSITTTATLSYGYGIGITILHLAKAILGVITGYPITPKLVYGYDYERPKRVYSRKTVREMLAMMEDVVQKQNRKTLAIEDIRIGAKTGTANMLVNGKYVEEQNFVTLATVLPIDKPKVLIILQMSNPKKERLVHGKFTTAANVLSKYMRELIAGK